MKELASLFKVNSKPVEFSLGQQQIFESIIYLLHKRIQVIAPTQYGKSLTVGLAVLLRAIVKRERFSILAPSQKKANIIMGYCIEHCFDAALFTEALELDKNESLDRLRRERSKNELTFKGGGGIKTLTLDAKNGKRSIEAAMGFGGKRLILDESSLIDDPLYATVKRMLGGHDYADTFLFEIGNPFYRNHFHRTWSGDRYFKLFIDYHQALSEGRYSPEFIEEMREEAFFDIFYECLFPDEDEVDGKGYRVLLRENDLIRAEMLDIDTGEDDWLRLGVDIGGGGDYNVYVLRNERCAWIAHKNQSTDTMSNVDIIESLMKDNQIEAQNVFIDDIGIGRGVTDRLKEKGLPVNGISVGGKSTEPEKYANIKAEAYWKTRVWLMNGGKLMKSEKWRQLNWIKYKVSSDKQLQIQPKEELKKERGRSPDFAEALMLTFAPQQSFVDIKLL
ncbi:MAG: hypothetical protein M3Q44_07400 [bacterium]|nr:hypothetical protein [bacterium]